MDWDRLTVASACVGAASNQVPPTRRGSARWVLHSDARVEGWEHRTPIEWSSGPHRDRRNAKPPKVLSLLVHPDADLVVWVDANLSLAVSPNEVAAAMGDADLGLFRHSERDCVYEEGRVVVESGFDDEQVVARQLGRYRQLGHPEGWGLYELRCFAIRRSPRTEAMQLAWFEDLCKWSSRDQISLPVAIRRFGASVATLPGTVYESPLLEPPRPSDHPRQDA